MNGKENAGLEVITVARAFAARIFSVSDTEEARAAYDDFHTLPSDIKHRTWLIVSSRKLVGRLTKQERASLKLISAEVVKRDQIEMHQEPQKPRRVIGLVRTAD